MITKKDIKTYHKVLTEARKQALADCRDRVDEDAKSLEIFGVVLSEEDGTILVEYEYRKQHYIFDFDFEKK